MPIVRYIGAVDTALRSFGKKVEVKPGQFVDVTKPEAEALRSSVYRKHFEGNEETLVREFASDEVTGNVASGREDAKKPETEVIPTKAEMYKELSALGVENVPEKPKADELFAILTKAREDAKKPETEGNATKTGDDSSDEPNAAQGGENATTGTQDAHEAGAGEVHAKNTEA